MARFGKGVVLTSYQRERGNFLAGRAGRSGLFSSHEKGGYGGIYPEEIKALQRDYEKLWRPLSDLLEKLSAIVRL